MALSWNARIASSYSHEIRNYSIEIVVGAAGFEPYESRASTNFAEILVTKW